MTALYPVLYQLYMIPAFRKGIMSIPETEFDNADNINSLLYELKKLFEEYDQDKLPDLKSLCSVFKDSQGNPTDPLVKIDAVEFLHNFFDQLENSLKSFGKSEILNEAFQGKMLHQVHCKECSHQKSGFEDFHAVPLAVRNKKGLEDALSAFVQKEVLDGDNRYFCDQCEKKTDAVKRVCLYEIPDYLCFSLKKFELDFETFEMVLLKDYYEIPDALDLKPFTHASLSEKNKEEESKSLSEEKERYCLSGIVIYSGISPERGFYYSLIRDREDGGTWYKIGPGGKGKFDPKDIAAEAFGEKYSEKSSGSAYMLFYDRIDSQKHHIYEREP